MRTALPNANFIAFTGTPLLGTKRLTNQWFGDYVSEYNFAQSVEDGSTVPLFYSRRVPEVGLENDFLDDDVVDIIEEENLNEDETRLLENASSRILEVIRRDDRLDKVAQDIAYHFPRRGFLGKGIVVSVDKYTAVKMYDKVQHYWAIEKQNIMKKRNTASTKEERDQLTRILAYMNKVEMAVIISEENDEETKFAKQGLKISEHRAKMKEITPDGRDIEDRFKNPNDSLQLVFVCAMWLTGFDVKNLSTLYLDKPMNCISYDVSMALLGSAVLGFIMSLTEYYVEKRKAMEEFWLQSNKILKELRKIKYLELDAPVELIKDALLEEQANYWNAKFPLLIDDSGITHKAKSALISWFEENIPMSFNEDSDIEAELEKYYSASLKTYKDTFLRCMRSYQDASSIDLGLIDNAYGNLDFIISNHSIRKYAYNNIFDKMRKFVYQFREEAYHFDLLNDGKGNFAVCVSKVVDLNKLFFAAKDVKAHGYVNTLVYQTAFDEIESELEKFRCKIYKTKYVPVKSSPISGMMRYFGEDSETKGTDE